MPVLKFVAHGPRVLRAARRFGWLPAARYTNLRDVRHFDRVGFLDIDWRHYSFRRHLEAVKATQPMVTVAHDLESRRALARVLDQAAELLEYCDRVLIIPKSRSLSSELEEVIPPIFGLAYSVPTKYGGCRIPPECFRRDVHLLGGRPDVQRVLADRMTVVSIDCNRFTLDAAFGDYFDGETFRPHPVGGYDRCITDSLKNIGRLWISYSPGKNGHRLWRKE